MPGVFDVLRSTMGAEPKRTFNTGQYQCPLCGQLFPTLSELLGHMDSMDKEHELEE